MNNNIDEIQAVEIYLDYATLPSLNYFLHFVENYQDRKTIRLFGLGRFSIPKQIIDAYPAGIIRFSSITVEDATLFYAQIEQCFSEITQNIRLSIHLNLFHSINMFLPLQRILQKYKGKFTEIKLNLYDDGAEGLISLHQISGYPHLEQVLNQAREEFHNTLTHHLDVHQLPDIARYLWNSIYPSTYHLLVEDSLENQQLNALRAVIGKHTPIDLTRYQIFNAEQQALMLNILQITPDFIAMLMEIFGKYKTFVFTGTTMFNMNEEAATQLENIHISALQHYIQPEGKYFIGEDYIPCVKGHPNSPEINKKLKQLFPNVAHLPPHIPFEVLYMLGCHVDKLGGFISTSYINFPKEKITDVLFITDEDINIQNSNYLMFMQAKLMNIMIEEHYLPASKAHYYKEILN